MFSGKDNVDWEKEYCGIGKTTPCFPKPDTKLDFFEIQ